MTRSPTPSRRMRSSASATLIFASSNGKSFRACSTIDELKSGILTVSLTAYLYAMNNAFAPKNVRSFAEIIADIGLLADPIEVAIDAGGEIDLRRVTGVANPFGTTRQVPHFAGTKFAVRLRCDMNAECVGNLFGDFSNAYAGAAADVNGMAIELVAFRGEQICPRDVLDEREVAGLLAVFVEDGPQIVEQSRAEDRDHARVGVENRLARTVGARVTQRDGGNPDLFSPQQNQFFLVDLRQPVNSFAADRCTFRSGSG